jgi:hypothetical protein
MLAPANMAKNHAGDIEGEHEMRERDQGRQPVLADGERHGAERPEWCNFHDDGDHAEQRVRSLIDDAEQCLAACSECLQAEGEQDGEKQHLQDLALGEGADHGVGNDVHQELQRALLLGFGDVALDRFGIDRGWIDVHAGAGLQRIGHDQADDQRQRRHHFEVDERLEADAADLAHVLHAGDAVHDRAEDDRCDDHFDHLDERIAQRLHLLGQLRLKVAEQHAGEDGEQDLEVEALEERLVPGRGGYGVGLHRGLSYRARLALRVGVDHGERSHVDDAAHADGRLEDVRGLGGAEQDRADRNAAAGGNF